ncbi:MAG: tetraacyldisaccharide 4'-kinase [Desulfosarcinaceae bacterium]
MPHRFREKLLEIMADRRSHPLLSPATVLWLASLVYEAGVGYRARLYRKGRKTSLRLTRPVVSVGNIALGGTGKTPMTVHIARIMSGEGYKAVILSRGYKGDHGRNVVAVSDGHRILADARQVGDEPCLMAHLLPGLPVVVGRDRHAAGKFAIHRFSPDFLLLDDGFQHLRLARDLNLLLLDGRHPFGNGHLFPRGMLRESPRALARSDAIVLTRAVQADSPMNAASRFSDGERPVFRAAHRPVVRGQVARGSACPALSEFEPVPLGSSWLKSLPLFAFSGLAGNAGFWESIRQAGGAVKGTLGFSDHHRYRRADRERLQAAALEAGAGCLVTTDKDYVRLPKDWRWEWPLLIMGVEMDFRSDQQRWQSYISASLARLRRSKV